MIADIVSGKTDTADLLYLIAVILFVVAAVISITDKAVVAALGYAGLAVLALAFLVL